MSKVVILGDGLLGSELERISQWQVESRRRTNLDIEDTEGLAAIVYQNDIIINCIAYTDSYNGLKKSIGE